MGMYTSLRVDGILKSDVYPEIRSIMDREGEVAKSYGQGFAMDCRGIYVGMPTPSIWDLASPRLRSLLGTFFEDCRRSFVSPTLGEGGLDVGGVPRRMVIDANLKNYTSTVEKFIHAIPALFESVAVCEWHYEEWDHGMSAELVGSEKMVAKREMERILAAPSGGKASAVLSGGGDGRRSGWGRWGAIGGRIRPLLARSSGGRPLLLRPQHRAFQAADQAGILLRPFGRNVGGMVRVGYAAPLLRSFQQFPRKGIVVCTFCTSKTPSEFGRFG